MRWSERRDEIRSINASSSRAIDDEKDGEASALDVNISGSGLFGAKADVIVDTSGLQPSLPVDSL